MDVNYSAEEVAFREEVRGFLREELPTDLSDAVRVGRSIGKEGHERWHSILNARGWLAPNWGQKQPETTEVEAGRRGPVEAKGRAAAPRVVAPGAAAHHPRHINYFHERINRIMYIFHSIAISITAESILTPFPYLAAHIVQA